MILLNDVLSLSCILNFPAIWHVGLQPQKWKFHFLMRLSIFGKLFRLPCSLWCFSFKTPHRLLSATVRLSLILLSSYQNSCCEPHFKGHRICALIIFCIYFFMKSTGGIISETDYIWKKRAVIDHCNRCYTKVVLLVFS